MSPRKKAPVRQVRVSTWGLDACPVPGCRCKVDHHHGGLGGFDYRRKPEPCVHGSAPCPEKVAPGPAATGGTR